MIESNINTPGVYINEINGFPDSVVPIATAVPVFIGYTPKAEYQGKSYTNKAQKITSFAEFQAFFCWPIRLHQRQSRCNISQNITW
jgi:phage tail sheath protein FI